MTDALLTLVQWLSPAFPVGSFAYSHGLELAMADGSVATPADLRDWLDDILRHGAPRNDAILLAAAFRAVTEETAEPLDEVAALAEALAVSAERHLETIAQGRAFAGTVNAVWPLDLPATALPVAVGAAAGRMGLPLEATLKLYLHGVLTGLVQAAVRFMPMGQTDGQRILLGLQAAIAATAAGAAAATLDDLGGCAYLSDIAAMRHEVMQVRIFRT
jgi:urease accessory protein